MFRLCSCITALCLLGSAAAAQKPASEASPERPSLKAHEYEIIASGCIRGKRLERPLIQSAPDDLPHDARNAANFALEGPKELLKRIVDEHKNHQDQIIGIAVVPPSMNRAQADVKTKRVGPINIGIGGRQETSAIQSTPQTVKLKVSSLIHVQDGCAPK
jgi:hypothetical protein